MNWTPPFDMSVLKYVSSYQCIIISTSSGMLNNTYILG